VFLAAVARTTQHIHLGVAVTVLPLHNPLEVAEAYGMLDTISQGRLEFGVGRGSTLAEFAPFNVDLTNTAQVMKESTEVIRRAWSGDALSFHGEVYDYEGVRVLPKPVQRPHPPIWVGASRTDDTFRWAGENGYHLMTLPYMYQPEVLQHWIGVYRDALLAHDHDPAQREVLGKFHIYVAESDRAAMDEANRYLLEYRRIADSRNGARATRAWDAADLAKEIERGNVIGGDPAHCIELIHRWREALGLTTISGTFHFGGMPDELALKNVRLFAEKVMPAFARVGAHRA
jgi:alkanesulfonate monooxygenase SsuD/methylene tetrahydromethanopterin reductase-like flavin-dependent oxidoreductase (luciferase family)